MAPDGWCLLFCYPQLINVHQFFILKRYFLLQFAKCLFMPHLKTVPRTNLLQGKQVNYVTATDCWLLEIKSFAGPDGEMPALPFDNGVKPLRVQSWASRGAMAKIPALESVRPGRGRCTYFGQVI